MFHLLPYDWVLTSRLFDCPPGVAAVRSYGHGCNGSNGLPLTHGVAGRPQLGTSFTLQIGNMLPFSIGMLAIGLDRTSWTLGALPFDLAPLGAPGCLVSVRPDVTIFVFGGPTGTTSFVQSIPNAPAFIGLPLYSQGLALDAAANSLGAVTSNAMESIVGN